MKKLFTSVTFLATLMSLHLHACTGIKLQAKDGSVIQGRTLEFGIEVTTSCVVIPRGYVFTGTTPNGTGLEYTSKYACVGAMAFNKPALMDGMNEKGLCVGTFYFPTFAGYAEITPENQERALSPIEFPNWIVTQFATIDEVKTALPKVVIAPTITSEWGPTPAPFHYIVFEKSGKCLVIEPINGKLVTHDNELGTFTNSPPFDWHMTNLRNYINLTPINTKPVTLNNVTFAPLGEGSGMVGLPGDFTPPSRFVRAAIFSGTATPSDSGEDAVYQAFHILNQFDIPVGIARTEVNGVVHTDETQITCVRDPMTLKYYFKTYNDQTIQMVDLNTFDVDAKEIKSLLISGTSKAKDVSSLLK